MVTLTTVKKRISEFFGFRFSPNAVIEPLQVVVMGEVDTNLEVVPAGEGGTQVVSGTVAISPAANVLLVANQPNTFEGTVTGDGTNNKTIVLTNASGCTWMHWMISAETSAGVYKAPDVACMIESSEDNSAWQKVGRFVARTLEDGLQCKCPLYASGKYLKATIIIPVSTDVWRFSCTYLPRHNV